jgi:hypothetical protein
MTEKLVNRLVSESSGKNLAAEIYEGPNVTYVVKYFINGSPAGETFFSETTASAVEDIANGWLNGVKNLYG